MSLLRDGSTSCDVAMTTSESALVVVIPTIVDCLATIVVWLATIVVWLAVVETTGIAVLASAMIERDED